MTTKERLHQLIDQLHEEAAEEAERLLATLTASEAMDPETAAWVEADLSNFAELKPYEWGPAGPPPDNPVRFIPGVGIVVEEAGDGN